MAALQPMCFTFGEGHARGTLTVYPDFIGDVVSFTPTANNTTTIRVSSSDAVWNANGTRTVVGASTFCICNVTGTIGSIVRR